MIERLESRIAPATVLALNQSGNFLRLDNVPGNVESLVNTDLPGGQLLREIDFRPATGEIVGAPVPPGSLVNSFAFTETINPVTGVAFPVEQAAAPLPGFGDYLLGSDFNPTIDRIRLTNANYANLPLNPANGSIVRIDTVVSPVVPLGLPPTGALGGGVPIAGDMGISRLARSSLLPTS